MSKYMLKPFKFHLNIIFEKYLKIYDKIFNLFDIKNYAPNDRSEHVTVLSFSSLPLN